MHQLIDGFRRWHETTYEENRGLFEALAQKQTPKVMLVGCCDSRVDPALIFGAQPGEIFVLRVVANLIPPYCPGALLDATSAALEFAIRALEVEHVIVLGHAHCGGVNALLNAPQSTEGLEFIESWVSIARSARDRALALTLSSGQPIEAAQRMAEHETVAISLGNLMTFPWIRERVAGKRLMLHGWWFDLDQGDLFRLDPMRNTFEKV